MSTTYYVKASISDDGEFAKCEYFYDYNAQNPVPTPQLGIPQAAGACVIAKAKGSDLVLIGASFKTLGQAPAMNSKNFSAADDAYAVEIPMPTEEVVTKGVVLLFSNPDKVDSLYPSSDPEVTNNF